MKKTLIRCLSAAAATIICLAQSPAGAAETAALKHYGNRYFQFDYPDSASLTVSADGSSIELNISQQSFLWLTMDEPSTAGHEDCGAGDAFVSCYIFQRAKTHCDADGPEGTVYCLDADVSKTTVLIGGKTGYQFHLIRTMENYDAGTNRKFNDPQLLYYFVIAAGTPKHRGFQSPQDRAGPHLQILEINGSNDAESLKVLGTLKFH